MNSQFSIFAHTLFMKSLVLLPPEAASLGEPKTTTLSIFLYILHHVIFSPGPAASGLAEDGGASGADHDSLGVAEDSGDPGVRE